MFMCLCWSGLLSVWEWCDFFLFPSLFMHYLLFLCFFFLCCCLLVNVTCLRLIVLYYPTSGMAWHMWLGIILFYFLFHHSTNAHQNDLLQLWHHRVGIPVHQFLGAWSHIGLEPMSGNILQFFIILVVIK